MINVDMHKLWMSLAVLMCISAHVYIRHALMPSPLSASKKLEAPNGYFQARASSMGDAHLAGVFMALELQNHDVQAGLRAGKEPNRLHPLSGQEIPWLRVIEQLDPANQTALNMATHILPLRATVPEKQEFLQWVSESVRLNPANSWRFLAFAAWYAQHQMHDRALALSLAKTLRVSATMAPPWARQLEVFLYESAGAYESAAALVASLLKSEKNLPITEQAFLLEKLEHLKQ